jgi:hypothetical protein
MSGFYFPSLMGLAVASGLVSPGPVLYKPAMAYPPIFPAPAAGCQAVFFGGPFEP